MPTVSRAGSRRARVRPQGASDATPSPGKVVKTRAYAVPSGTTAEGLRAEAAPHRAPGSGLPHGLDHHAGGPGRGLGEALRPSVGTHPAPGRRGPGLKREQRARDGILAVVDATNLYQGLFLLQQLVELQMPLVVALTMTDAAAQSGINIDVEYVWDET